MNARVAFLSTPRAVGGPRKRLQNAASIEPFRASRDVVVAGLRSDCGPREDGAVASPNPARAGTGSDHVDTGARAVVQADTMSMQKRLPALDLLRAIKAKVGVPLVLHGGSNNPDEEIAQAVKLGINKINISSDIKAAYYRKMREVLQDGSLREPNSIEPPCIAAMKVTAAEKIDLFDAAGKAFLY